MDDEFTGLDRSRWTVYDGSGDALGRWSPGDVEVAGGTLQLSVRRPGGAPPSTWGGIGAAGAGRRYGRWEVRMRMSAGRGVIGQFLLNPTGADPAIVVSVAPFHRTIAVSGTGTGAGGTRVAELARPADVHVVAVEWTPSAVRVLVDGAPAFEWTDGALPVPLWPAVQTIMAGPDCGAVPLPADCQGITTAFPQRLEVDRLRVQEYTG
jgi:beta-glucanase (GH16 family)